MTRCCCSRSLYGGGLANVSWRFNGDVLRARLRRQFLARAERQGATAPADDRAPPRGHLALVFKGETSRKAERIWIEAFALYDPRRTWCCWRRRSAKTPARVELGLPVVGSVASRLS